MSRPGIEEAGLVVAAGRQATATLSFEIDEHGDPIHFQIEAASAERWGAEAIALVREWQFTPGMKNGDAVSVPAVLMLVWGERKIAANVFEQLSDLTNP